jgi:hypothetical protein
MQAWAVVELSVFLRTVRIVRLTASALTPWRSAI